MQTVLVTGGTGFVGGWCIVEALRAGHAVRTTVRSDAKAANVRAAVAKAGLSDAKLSFAVADLTDDAGWDDALAGCELILHVASPLAGAASVDRDAYVAPARDGTLRVLRAAVKAGAKRVVMTSAAAAARTPIGSDQVSDETVWADPEDPRFDGYRRSKILAERAAWDFMRAEGGATQFTTILPGAVFGPVLSTETLGSVAIIQGMMQGRPPGLPRLAFWIVDARDLAAAHVKAMVEPAAVGERFIVAGEMLWMYEVADALRAGLGERGARVPSARLPDAAVKALALVNPQMKNLISELGRRNELTSAKARRVLGFAPRPVVQTLIDCANSLPPV